MEVLGGGAISYARGTPVGPGLRSGACNRVGVNKRLPPLMEPMTVLLSERRMPSGCG